MISKRTPMQWKRILEKSAKLQQQRLYPVVPSRYTDFCESEEDQSMMPIGLFTKKSLRFQFNFFSFPNLQDVTRFLDDFKQHRECVSKVAQHTVHISYNSIQERVFDKLYRGIPSFDNEWFEECNDFIKALPLREKMALVAMTNKSQQHVQAYLRNNISHEFRERIRNWRDDVFGYMPIFFQVLDILDNKDYTPSKSTYKHVVRNVCPSLDDNTIDKCIGNLSNEVENIFKKCPKTRTQMILIRGIKSDEMSVKKGKWIYQGFTATSLDPSRVFKYIGDNCCVQRITILPKTPLLFLGGLSSFQDDMECLLPNYVYFYKVKQKHEVLPTTKKMNSTCIDNTKRIVVQDLVTVF